MALSLIQGLSAMRSGPDKSLQPSGFSSLKYGVGPNASQVPSSHKPYSSVKPVHTRYRYFLHNEVFWCDIMQVLKVGDKGLGHTQVPSFDHLLSSFHVLNMVLDSGHKRKMILSLPSRSFQSNGKTYRWTIPVQQGTGMGLGTPKELQQ